MYDFSLVLCVVFIELRIGILIVRPNPGLGDECDLNRSLAQGRHHRRLHGIVAFSPLTMGQTAHNGQL